MPSINFKNVAISDIANMEQLEEIAKVMKVRVAWGVNNLKMRPIIYIDYSSSKLKNWLSQRVEGKTIYTYKQFMTKFNKTSISFKPLY